MSDRSAPPVPLEGERREPQPGELLLARFVPDVIVTLDFELRLTSLTHSVERLLGFAVEELLGQPVAALVNGPSLARASRLLARERANEGLPEIDPMRTQTLDLELRRKDGGTVWTEVQIGFVRDADGLATAIIAVARDFSARRETREALRQSEERLRQIIDLVPHFIFAKDLEGRFLLVNRAVAEAYGTTVEGITGRTDADFASSPEEVRRFRSDDLEVIQSGRPKIIELEQITDAQGVVRHLHTMKIPFSTAWAGTPAVLGVATDISERLRAEARLRERDEQLRQDQKMRAIGQLAGGLAHDFNNLLTVILGNVEPLLDAIPPGERWRREAEQIRLAAERAAALTGQLLAFSRKQVVAPASLDLNEVVRETEQILERLIGEHIRLSTDFGQELPRVRMDRSQVEQLLLNLTVNARDAMPEGGRLHFATALGAPLPAHGDELPTVRLTVRDTGAGMDTETRARAFEPFFTTKAQGTGLGLATVYAIVEQAGGTVTLASELGRGTTVEILLPGITAAPATAPAHPAAEPQAGGETILLVEDEEAIRSLMCDALGELGYRILGAAEADAALGLAEGFAGAIDLLITDVVLPGLSGPHLAERMAALRPGLRVLFISGYPEQILDRGEPFEGTVGFLAKPFRPLELARKIRSMLDSPAAKGGAGGPDDSGSEANGSG
jgi:two-component system, cell cycle sensor histidine kinase and response regulator CckA